MSHYSTEANAGRLQTIVKIPSAMTREVRTEISFAGAHTSFDPIRQPFDHPDLIAIIVVLPIAFRAGVVLGPIPRIIPRTASSTILE